MMLSLQRREVDRILERDRSRSRFDHDDAVSWNMKKYLRAFVEN